MCVLESAGSKPSVFKTTAPKGSTYKVIIPQDGNGVPLLIRTRTEGIEGILPVSKGGTGIRELNGSKVLASSADGNFIEEIEIPVQYLSGLNQNIQSKLDSIRAYSVQISVDEEAWTKESEGYSRTVILDGITASDNPIIGLKNSSNNAVGIETEQYAYSCIDKVVTNNGSITIYCLEELPTSEITIWLACV